MRKKKVVKLNVSMFQDVESLVIKRGHEMQPEVYVALDRHGYTQRDTPTLKWYEKAKSIKTLG